MAVRVHRVKPEKGKRVIVISDIHADLRSFQMLLDKVHFTQQDILVLAGDMVEKGSESLATLRYIMNLRRSNTVYAVCGNCEDIVNRFYASDQNEALLHYLLLKEHTLIGEMCRAQGIRLSIEMEMKRLKKCLRETYQEEIGFIEGLPHILELGDLTIAHAAVYPGCYEAMEPKKVMKVDNYMNLGFCFNQLHIVGHWPVVLYCQQIQDNNPRYDTASKIISIDGGNIIKRDGQLNALLLPDAYSEQFTCDFVDGLPRARALTRQQESETSFNIRWIDSKVEPLAEEGEFFYCRHITSKVKMWIPKEFLCEEPDGWHTEDISDYQLGVDEGDILAVSLVTSRGYLCKKNGISGWYQGRLEYL